MKTFKHFPIYTILFVIGFILLCVYIWLSTQSNLSYQKKKRDSLAVTVIHPQIKPMPVMLEALGTIEPAQTVNIVPQVRGVLRKIHFEEGGQVTQGQLLFDIDTGLYSAALDEANANLQRDQANWVALKADADRYAALSKLEYVTRQQYDNAQAAVAAQAAVIQSDLALVNQAKIQLSYTQIHAPISGKISYSTVHVGDLITPNSTSPLAVINQLNPVRVNFSLPQTNLAEIEKYQKQGTLRILIRDENSTKILSEGKELSINNTANYQTGTVQLKALIENKNGILWPGTFVAVCVILTTESKALVIPSQAIQLGQKGYYVYVVKQGKAVVQPIQLSREIQEEAVIASGLTGQETVVSEVPSSLSDGKLVQINSPSQTYVHEQR